MKFLRKLAALAPLALFALLVFSVSCGGGGGGGSYSPPPPPPPPPQPLQITSSSIPNAIVGDSYRQQLQATGGVLPYTWSLGQGESFVNGLTLSSGGLLSGDLTLSGSWCPTFWVTDATTTRTNWKTLCLSIFDRLAIMNNSLPSGLLTRDYDQYVQAFGGTAPYTWSIEAGGNLPPGLTMESTGRLHGVPTSAGTYSFTLRLNDSATQQTTKGYTVAVYDGPLITTNPLLPVYITGQSYSVTFQATTGVPPYTWDVAPTNPYGGSLPAGFTLTSGGVFSGSSNNYGFWGFWVRVTDSLGHSDIVNFALRMVQPLNLPAQTLPGGNVGIQYLYQVPLNGGFGPYSWGLAAGSGPLPPGIPLGAFGYLFGSPTAPGSYDFTIEVSDSINEVATQSYSILIKDDVIIVELYSLPYGIEAHSYSSPTLKAVGGTAPYTWSVTNGSLPPGLAMDSATGQITGTSTQAGTFNFDVQATDLSIPQKAGIQRVGILIRPPLVVTTANLPDAAVNVQYTGIIQADGGAYPPYSVRISAGSLPSGLSLSMGNSSTQYGEIPIFGLPSATGVSNFTIEVSDSSSPPSVVTKDFSIRIFPQLRIDQGTGSLPDSLEGQPFTYTFTATGGVSPYTWSVRNAPAGMAVNSATGVFDGSPTQGFSGIVFADVVDSATPPQHPSQGFFWRVSELLKIRTSQFPPLSVGVPVRMNPWLTGGTCCAFTWSISSGSLPPGLSMTDPINGEISGTPTTPGTFNFSLQVKDSATGSLAQSVSKSLSIVVKPQGQLGRNDSIATATPLSNGTYLASISPADNGFGAFHPDNDYFAISADPGAIVTVETYADQRIPPGSSMDSVIEILDVSGVRYSTCNSNGDSLHSGTCMNDDRTLGDTNSLLFFQVPGTPGGPPVTFYVRVLDWSGMARPDFLYTITIFGAN